MKKILNRKHSLKLSFSCIVLQTIIYAATLTYFNMTGSIKPLVVWILIKFLVLCAAFKYIKQIIKNAVSHCGYPTATVIESIIDTYIIVSDLSIFAAVLNAVILLLTRG